MNDNEPMDGGKNRLLAALREVNPGIEEAKVEIGRLKRELRGARDWSAALAFEARQARRLPRHIAYLKANGLLVASILVWLSLHAYWNGSFGIMHLAALMAAVATLIRVDRDEGQFGKWVIGSGFRFDFIPASLSDSVSLLNL